ncbi:MAG TPA: cupredoxin domain-containing protein [Pilimelia sp.]|nr:cupredoxin domain-containing protein [Pilimelia sp.]
MLVGLLLAGLVAGGGAAFARPDSGVHAAALDDPVIVIQNFTFQGTLTVPPGATIVIRNADTAPHTITAIDGAFDTGTISGRTSTTLVAPTTPGSYPFRCNIHRTMTATLVVAESATPSPDPTVTPSPDPTATPSPDPTATPTADPTPTDPVIVIMDFAFQVPPAIPPNTVITVRNADLAPHTLTADDGSFDTGLISPGGTATITASAEPGSRPFHCSIHSFMTATLLVASADTPTPPPPTETVPPGAAPAAHHGH